LKLSDAIGLAKFALSKKFQGVMTWDADIDRAGVDGNAPYAFSKAI